MKRQRKKFEHPLKPWSAERLATEHKLINDYGLRRKREIWRAEAILRGFRRLARQLVAKKDKKQEKILLNKLESLGLIDKNSTLDDVLALSVEKILSRRLQTIVFNKGLANNMRQARQFIVHGHIAIDNRRVCWPSTLVLAEQEDKISFYNKSKLKGWVSAKG